jgi:hypothetical protein
MQRPSRRAWRAALQGRVHSLSIDGRPDERPSDPASARFVHAPSLSRPLSGFLNRLQPSRHFCFWEVLVRALCRNGPSGQASPPCLHREARQTASRWSSSARPAAGVADAGKHYGMSQWRMQGRDVTVCDRRGGAALRRAAPQIQPFAT